MQETKLGSIEIYRNTEIDITIEEGKYENYVFSFSYANKEIIDLDYFNQMDCSKLFIK